MNAPMKPVAKHFLDLSDHDAETLRGMIEDACRRAQAIRKPIGILAPLETDARAYFDMGFQFVAVGSDIVTLRKGCDALVKMFKGS